MATDQIVEKKDRCEGKGRVIALSRRVYRIVGSDVFYVESESNDAMFYYVMFNTAKEFEWCSCKDHERNGYRTKCKHLYGVAYAIRSGTVTDTDKLPMNLKKDNSIEPKESLSASLSWKEDEYSF